MSDAVTIIGSGAGATVIDAGGLSSTRHFQVSGQNGALELRRMTLTGGSAGAGASIRVESNTNPGGTALTLNEVAVVNNGNVVSYGGGVAIGTGATALIDQSVIANDSTDWGGGGIVAEGAGSVVTLRQSVIANNASTQGDPDIATSGSGMFVSGGNNLIGNAGMGNFTLDATDYESPTGAVDYVVTSLLDTFDSTHANNSPVLSLREAVNFANTDNGGESEVWLPGWNFILTRFRDYSTQLTDTDVSYGDIDISESIVLRGIEGATTIDWHSRIPIPNNNRDKIFDLLGSTANGTGNATADGASFLIWQREFGGGAGSPEYEEFLADFDDDGDVDGDDQGAVWQQYFGNTLDLEGLTVLS